MPSAAVEAAFQARLAANWSQTPIISEGPHDPPGSANAFLVVQYPVQSATKPVLQRVYFEEGAARMLCKIRQRARCCRLLHVAKAHVSRA